MIRLVERSVTEGVQHHMRNPVRVYSEDELQKLRIERTRQMAYRALGAVTTATIVEVGCGAADISGWMAKHAMYQWQAIGIECHQGALIEAALRYGNRFIGLHANIVVPAPGPLVDLVILSEVLEHLEDPNGIAAGWLKRAKTSVISHPLNEPFGSSMSGGDHCWSFSEEDHRAFFAAGGHEIEETEKFQLGCYTIILSRGRRAA